MSSLWGIDQTYALSWNRMQVEDLMDGGAKEWVKTYVSQQIGLYLLETYQEAVIQEHVGCVVLPGTKKMIVP